ncbi:tyrosine-type recombinase/integrase [Lysinibacillus sphaericus]|uniref:tyrosine-type recombinase/integrase n=1 Tax=Lysinibacillus sphaericus TaxID=1421 RepID=UPI0018CEB1F0|nr:tyrosine-type recombinase/integrase [Lysinibacillus sphaericus]
MLSELKKLNNETVDIQKYLANKELTLNRKAVIEKNNQQIPDAYKYDIRLFLTFCEENSRVINVESMIDYLYLLIVKEQVKKNSFEKKLQAIKKYMAVEHDIDFKENDYFSDQLKGLRKLFNDTKYADQNIVEGKKPLEYDEMMKKLNQLEVRPRAICFVNYITGNRPNEMVSLKIKHFDFNDKTVQVHLKKQAITIRKVLTDDVIHAVKAYIELFKLKDEDYFVGQVNRYGQYKSKEITMRSYWEFLNKQTELSGYNFRKSIIKRMHDNGADLPTIAKQTGHQNLNTITDHYLKVSKDRVKQFLD